MLQLGVDSTTQVQTSTTKNMKMFFRVMLIMALPFIAYFPAVSLRRAVCCFALFERPLTISPRLRRPSSSTG